MKIQKFVDLCSGIGGGRLGLENAGLSCVAYSDTSKLSCRTYNLMHDTENEIYFYNLKRIKSEQMPDYDLLIAGFPCQSFSVIGRKDGFSDDRGQIIFHLARILDETKPPCFLFENVKGLVTHDKGNTLKIILNELNKSGYDVTYKVLTSLNYGVPQMRQRVYFVGFRKDLKINIDEFNWPKESTPPPLSDFLIDNCLASEERLDILKHYLHNSTNNGKFSIQELEQMEGKILDTRMNDLRIYDGKCPTLRAQRDGILYVKNHQIHQLTGYEALLLQGFPKEKADLVKNEVSDRHLLMQAGNAMTVNVIAALGKSIIKTIEKGKKMSTWKDFEQNATDYLNNTYGGYATFTHKGEEDSTVPDILVETNTGVDFYIEAKHSPAQCGQFVLIPNIETESFDYSDKNINPNNEPAKRITSYMNMFFDEFKEAGTAGKDIVFDNCNQVFTDWIIDIYKKKNVRYIITNDFTILPLEAFANHFSVSAKYRVKRSGSSAVGISRHTDVSNYIEDEYSIDSIATEGDKLFVESKSNLDKTRFILGKYEYMFSKRGNIYEVRKLSNTFNANVIFSINKNSEAGISRDDFIKALQ